MIAREILLGGQEGEVHSGTDVRVDRASSRAHDRCTHRHGDAPPAGIAPRTTARPRSMVSPNAARCSRHERARMVEHHFERGAALLDRRLHRQHVGPAIGSARSVTLALEQFGHPHQRHEVALVDRQRAFERRRLAGIVMLFAPRAREVHPQFGRNGISGDRALEIACCIPPVWPASARACPTHSTPADARRPFANTSWNRPAATSARPARRSCTADWSNR